MIKAVHILIFLFSLMIPACYAQDGGEGHVLGLTRAKHHWKRVKKVIPWRSTIYFYSVDGPQGVQEKPWPKKLKGVPDLRKYEQKFPVRHWIQETCHRWSPVTNMAAALALPMIQAVKKQGGTI